ncbi:MAG: radical SAM protein [Deltaproteobacteria bacterium]|nr:radical SAM protein [Deltaproteobacteria bacterium]
MDYKPSYLSLYESGELDARIERLRELLKSCILCPRQCHVNRLEGERGVCGAELALEISSAFPHFGEEPPLVGSNGSGTIFLTHCNLKCEFCQNSDISHLGRGKKISPEEMAGYMVALQKQGCHNINFVTPTHLAPQIVSALPHAVRLGLNVPLVYNCGGYEALAVIKLLEGIIDIYMPDAKFADPAAANKYCNAPDYPLVLEEVLKEMHRQVGVLHVDSAGRATRGLLIRHLVMPQGLTETEKILRFIADELSQDSYVNIMDQYHPHYNAYRYPELRRRITTEEYLEALAIARRLGLHRGF